MVCVVCYYVVKCSWCLFGVPYPYGVVLQCIAVGVCYCAQLLLLAVSVYVVSAVSVYVFAVVEVVYYSCCNSFVYLRGLCCLISCCGSRCSLMWLLSEISVKRGAGTSPIQHLLFLTCLVNIA